MSNLFCLWLCREPTEIRQKVRKIYFIPTFFVFIKQTLQPVFTGLARQYNISEKLLTLTSLGGTLCPPHRLTMGHGTVLGSSTMSLFTYTWEKWEICNRSYTEFVYPGRRSKIDDVLLEHGGLPHVLPLAVYFL